MAHYSTSNAIFSSSRWPRISFSGSFDNRMMSLTNSVFWPPLSDLRFRSYKAPNLAKNGDTFFFFLFFCLYTFFADTYMPWWQIYETKRVLKKRMIKRKLRRHLDSAASRGPPWKASLQGKSLTVILAPTLSGISGYHLHLILFLLSWENIT